LAEANNNSNPPPLGNPALGGSAPGNPPPSAPLDKAAQASIQAAVAALMAKPPTKKSPLPPTVEDKPATSHVAPVRDRNEAAPLRDAEFSVDGRDVPVAETVRRDSEAVSKQEFMEATTTRSRLPALSVVFGANVVFLLAAVFIVMKIVTMPVPAQSSTASQSANTTYLAQISTLIDAPGSPTPWPSAYGLSVPPAVRVSAPSTVSWEQAEKDYRAGHYGLALAHYVSLVEQWEKLPGDQLVCDFLRLRLANCLVQLNDLSGGREWYQLTSQSRSPAVRASSLYQLAALELLEGQHLRARALAMQALVSAATAESSALTNFQAQCDALGARALTEKAVRLWGGQWASPWRDVPQVDPFAGLAEKPLRLLLTLGSAVELPLAVRVTPVSTGGTTLYAVRCSRAPLEDVLARVASASGMDVHWVNVPPAVRQRAVTLALPAVNPSRAVELSCGVAGLIGRCVGDRIEVLDTDAFAEQSRQRQSLANEAQSAWRRYVLRYPEDRHVGEALYAVGGMMEALDEPVSAVNEYQLLVTNHRRSPMAPKALYRCATLRLGLKQYAQARRDLTELLDLFPDYAALDEVELSLGEATLAEGLPREALKIFERVVVRQTSPAATATATLSSGLCHQRLGQHEQALTWIGRFLRMDSRPSPAMLALADMAMARSYLALDKPTEAVGCLQSLLRIGGVEMMVEVEAALLLAEVQLERGRYGGALSALARLSNYELMESQNIRYVLTTVSAYSRSGLTDKAVTFARSRTGAIRDTRQVARVQVELARGHRLSGELEQAQRLLSTWLPKLPPEQAADASVDLAEICLLLDKPLQTVALLKDQVADLPDAALRARAVGVLGRAYMALGHPEQAATVYAKLGKPAGSLAAAGGGS